MGEAAPKKKILIASEEPQWIKKPIEARPLMMRVPTVLTFGANSSFHGRQNPSFESFAEGGLSSNAPLSYLQPASTNASLALATLGDADEDNTGQVDGNQGGQSSLVRKFDLNMDPKKFKQIMGNRVNAQRFRMRKTQHMVDLERQTKSFRTRLVHLQAQVSGSENKLRLLLIEQRKLKMEMAAREKQFILQEVEIGKKKAELSILREELQRKQEQARAQAAMPDGNSVGQVGGENSKLQVDEKPKEPLGVEPNAKLVKLKSEPMD